MKTLKKLVENFSELVGCLALALIIAAYFVVRHFDSSEPRGK